MDHFVESHIDGEAASHLHFSYKDGDFKVIADREPHDVFGWIMETGYAFKPDLKRLLDRLIATPKDPKTVSFRVVPTKEKWAHGGVWPKLVGEHPSQRVSARGWDQLCAHLRKLPVGCPCGSCRLNFNSVMPSFRARDRIFVRDIWSGHVGRKPCPGLVPGDVLHVLEDPFQLETTETAPFFFDLPVAGYRKDWPEKGGEFGQKKLHRLRIPVRINQAGKALAVIEVLRRRLGA